MARFNRSDKRSAGKVDRAGKYPGENASPKRESAGDRNAGFTRSAKRVHPLNNGGSKPALVRGGIRL